MTAAAVVPAIPPEVRAAAGQGFRLFPVEGMGKLPLIKGWPEAATNDTAQLEAWSDLYPACNWGLATGTASGLVVIDVDGAEGRASLADLERQGLMLPATLTVTTGRSAGGEHRYYRMPAGVDLRNDQSGKIGPQIDVRGTGGFVVIPPSIHPSGKQYSFIDSDVPIAELPGWVIDRLTVRRPMPTAAAQTSSQAVGKGSRTNRLVSLAGTMHRCGMSLDGITAALLAENAAFDPPMPETKVRTIAADIVKRYPVGEPALPPVPALPTMTPEDTSRITGELLEKCRAWIRRFIVLHDGMVTVLACWLLHTHAFDAAVVTPYLHIHSPEKGSGKTTLMRVLKALARGPRFSSGISAAALARVVAKDKPTLFIDELDALMKGDREKAQDIRGVLDGGFDVSGTYTRCVGKDLEVKDFPTFGPKVLGGIGELWDTVSSRSISVEMRRRLPSEKVEAFRQRRIEKYAIPIREALQAWGGGGVVDLLEQIEVTDVPGLDDRQMDISEPLLQIAQLAGDGWPQRLTGALQMIFKAACAEDTSIGVTLLRDIRSAFEKRREDQLKDADEIPSKDLAAQLCEIEGRLWAELSRGKGLSPNILAQQLKKFSIHPQGIRVGDKTPKGYRRAAFEDAWARYCPLTPSQSATPPQPSSPLTEAASSDRNTHTPVAIAKSASNPHEYGSVAAVAVQKPGEAQMSFFGSSTDDRPGDATTPAEVWI